MLAKSPILTVMAREPVTIPNVLPGLLPTRLLASGIGLPFCGSSIVTLRAPTGERAYCLTLPPHSWSFIDATRKRWSRSGSKQEQISSPTASNASGSKRRSSKPKPQPQEGQ